MKYVLNASILTDYGKYTFEKTTLEEARKFLQSEFISAIGHQTTAELLSNLLGIKVETNRTIAPKLKKKPKAYQLLFSYYPT